MTPDKKEAEEKGRERDVSACSALDPADPARRRSSPSCSSVLVLFRGLPGVGKSTLARAVSLELGSAPLVDKDDTRDALAEVFSTREEEEGEENGGQRDGELFRQRLNEASYAAAFNAARTLFLSSRCPCVLVDSPLSRPSAAERALRLAEELKREREKEKSDDGGGGAAATSSSPLAFVVVAVGTSDEALWRRRLEGRAAVLAASGSFSARHKPRRWAEVEALRDRGRRELLLGEEEENGGGGGGGGSGERGDSTSSRSFFGERMLRDLGVDRPNALPFSRLWRAASARFVVDSAAAGGGERGGEREGAAFTRAAAGRVAAAVRGALLAGEEGASGDENGVVFLGER